MNVKQLKQIKLIDMHPKLSSFKEEVINGLNAYPKYLSPKFFYDEEGSRLFEEICLLDEYYPTRTEIKIIADNIAEIKAYLGKKPVIIEFGSGASEKIKHLLSEVNRHAIYCGIDISKDFLIQATSRLSDEFPHIDVYAICADFTKHIELPEFTGYHKVAFFPGSTIGNFNPDEALSFMKNSRSLLSADDGFLIGVDLHKSKATLEDAYNDSKGVTADFNLNILNRINNELDMDFDLEKFEHSAIYNEQFNRIEMHLRCLVEHTIFWEDQKFVFMQNETIHTENSYKYTDIMLQNLFENSGYEWSKSWRDKNNLFSLNYLKAV